MLLPDREDRLQRPAFIAVSLKRRRRVDVRRDPGPVLAARTRMILGRSWQDLGVLRQQPCENDAVTLRPPRAQDMAVLIAARDEAFRRWLGTGSDAPAPTACIVAGEQVVGWIDYDHDPDHDWLGDGEVNIGYFVFAQHRGNSYATRAVELLLQQLARDAQYTAATLLIDPENEASLAVARRCGFDRQHDVRGQRYFTRSITRDGRQELSDRRRACGPL
jgi:RimJ/RimL family protein N-acetyltransferase